MRFKTLILITYLLAGNLQKAEGQDFAEIRGVNFVAPRHSIQQQEMAPISAVGANYVGIVPYAFSYPDQPQVIFDTSRQWWGERTEGAIATMQYARNLGLNIMLKPHVWIFRQGWPGDFQLRTESQWKQWEDQYREYILSYAQIAQDLNVEVFCLGTEFRKAAVQRHHFWVRLIADVKNIYKGKVTYAANWDNYQNIKFWNYLDFIGIDAYFPLTENADPAINELKAAWIFRSKELQKFSKRWSKPILFTEYGYQSMDHGASSHWDLDSKQLNINLDLQKKAYRALFETIWSKSWFAGGFLWKWHSRHYQSGGSQNKSWTPQNKPAQEIIENFYRNR